jgi:hypothetical protein
VKLGCEVDDGAGAMLAQKLANQLSVVPMLPLTKRWLICSRIRTDVSRLPV